MGLCGIHLRPIWQEVLMISIRKMSFNNTRNKLLQFLPGDNELIYIYICIYIYTYIYVYIYIYSNFDHLIDNRYSIITAAANPDLIL